MRFARFPLGVAVGFDDAPERSQNGKRPSNAIFWRTASGEQELAAPDLVRSMSGGNLSSIERGGGVALSIAPAAREFSDAIMQSTFAEIQPDADEGGNV